MVRWRFRRGDSEEGRLIKALLLIAALVRMADAFLRAGPDLVLRVWLVVREWLR
jgi:hypothetical protein